MLLISRRAGEGVVVGTDGVGCGVAVKYVGRNEALVEFTSDAYLVKRTSSAENLVKHWRTSCGEMFRIPVGGMDVFMTVNEIKKCYAVRFGFEADKSIRIDRDEVRRIIESGNGKQNG